MNRVESVFCVKLLVLIDNTVIFDIQSYEKTISVKEIKSCLFSFLNEVDKSYVPLIEKIGMDDKKISKETLAKEIMSALTSSFMYASDRSILSCGQELNKKFVEHFAEF